MNTNQAEIEARRYLDTVTRKQDHVVSDEDYEKALRLATASFSRLLEAVHIAEQNERSAS